MEFTEIALTEQSLAVIIPLTVGVIADAIIGDPYKLPHPIRLFGSIISKGEKMLNIGESRSRKVKGGVMSITLIIVTFIVLFAIDKLLVPYTTPLYIWRSIVIFYSLANRSLINEGLKVERAVLTGDIKRAQEQVGYIVGRKTDKLTFNQIRVATLETLSENLSDGVIAPLFYFAIGGVPLMLTYKMVNTLDSMIGYKNSRYLDFGAIAAKVDDIFNYIPARVTALLIALVGCRKRGFSFIFRYGSKHASPNAGYPEAALAGVLNCRFGGPTVYSGYTSDKPYIGDNNRDINTKDIERTVIVNIISTAIATLLIITLHLYI